MWQRSVTPWIKIKDELYNTGQIVKINKETKTLNFSNGENIILEKENFNELYELMFKDAIPFGGSNE